MKTFFQLLSILALTGTLACSTSPTGRTQFTVMPDSQMNAIGAKSFSQMKEETPIEKDPRTNEYVKCIAMAIAREATDTTGVSDWEVVVFKDNSANAFALPGGKIGVHTGMLTVAKTAAQLAAVLGHEVGHVIARHGNERVSQNVTAGGAMTALALLNKDNPNRNTIMAAAGLGTQFGILLPFSRSHESEADKIGLDLMARAGFDPHESVALWQNMSASGGKQPPQWMSTHPSHETRISKLQEGIPEAMDTYNRARSSGKNPNCVR